MIPITSADDPRIAAYRNLKDRQLAREGERFIAEGEFILRRLLASDYPVESVLLSDRRAAQLAPIVGAGVPVYVGTDDVLGQILGFKFHSGIIAVGRRKPGASIEQIASPDKVRATLVICPETSNADNMGSLVRIAAAFGADGMILGERCCDPFWRQSIRVSMGTIFSMPLVQSDDLMRDLRRLKSEFGYEFAATVLDGRAEPLERSGRSDRLGILLGNESQGLAPEYVAVADHHVTIPMRPGVDSLNVAVAAGIILYHFTRVA